MDIKVLQVSNEKDATPTLLETLATAGRTPPDRKNDARAQLARKGYRVRALNEGPFHIVAYVEAERLEPSEVKEEPTGTAE